MEFPSNSINRENRKPIPVEAEPSEPRKPVVSGKVVLRPKSLTNRIIRFFGGNDLDSVGRFVAQEIIAPGLRDMLSQSVGQGFDRLIFGQDQSGRRSSGSRFDGGAGRPSTAYHNMGRRPNVSVRNDDRGRSGSQRRSPDLQDLVFEDHLDALEVIDELYATLERYKSVSVATLYEITGVEGVHHQDDRWGWRNLDGSRPTRTRDGYRLVLPELEYLS